MRRAGKALVALTLLPVVSACTSHALARTTQHARPGTVTCPSLPAAVGADRLYATLPETRQVLPLLTGDCLVIDGKPVVREQIAAHVATLYENAVRADQARASIHESSVPIPPVTSIVYVRVAVADEVLAALERSVAERDHLNVAASIVDAAVANCRQAPAEVRHAAPGDCSVASFRDDYLIKAEEDRIRASGETTAAWFTHELSRHHIAITGYPISVDELAAHLFDPAIPSYPK